MDALPRELVERIFGFLSPRFLWQTARRVSPLWRELVETHPTRWILAEGTLRLKIVELASHHEDFEVVATHVANLSFSGVTGGMAVFDNEVAFGRTYYLSYPVDDEEDVERSTVEAYIEIPLPERDGFRRPELWKLPWVDNTPRRGRVGDWILTAVMRGKSLYVLAGLPVALLLSEDTKNWDLNI
jgi:hypothetical protein